jgi:hypothetical protein
MKAGARDGAAAYRVYAFAAAQGDEAKFAVPRVLESPALIGLPRARPLLDSGAVLRSFRATAHIQALS